MTLRLELILALSSVTAITNAIGQTNQPAASDTPVITVCEALQDLAKYNGKSVVIVGRFGSTMEGGWLSQECEHKIVADGETWDNIISTTYIPSRTPPPPVLPNAFRWDDKRLRPKLEEVTATTKLVVLKKYHYSDRWVAMFGRFETNVQDANRDVRNPRVNGFGHLNAAPGQLVWPKKGFHEIRVNR